jgi:hypothetical protein
MVSPSMVYNKLYFICYFYNFLFVNFKSKSKIIRCPRHILMVLKIKYNHKICRIHLELRPKKIIRENNILKLKICIIFLRLVIIF